jgi:hypothetical protein
MNRDMPEVYVSESWYKLLKITWVKKPFYITTITQDIFVHLSTEKSYLMLFNTTSQLQKVDQCSCNRQKSSL